jgi:hypothetical protein
VKNLMMQQLRIASVRVFSIAAVLFFAMAPGYSAEPVEKLLFSRADLVDTLTGQVEFRRAYPRELRLPLPECAEGRWVCFENAMYGQVYELTFTAEKLFRGRDGVPAIARTSHGRLLVALDLAKETEDDFEDALRADLAALSPAAFSLPQAGMGYMKGALSQSLLVQSVRPAWVCAELGGAYTCEIRVGRDKGYSADGEIGGDAGRRIAQGLAGVPPEIIRTPPDVLAQKRTEVRFRSSSTLAGLTWSDRLATVPQGAKFTKRPLDGKKTGGIRDTLGGAFRGHEGRYGENERDVLLPSASLELLGVPMWVGKWRFDTTHETFGETPTIKHDAPVSVVLAVVPISDPLMDDLSRAQAALTVPAEVLVDSVVAFFKHNAKLDPSLVEEALWEPKFWPGTGDWLIVACRDDGTARYGIAPFASAAVVTNPREACAAIRRELK